MLVKPVQRIKKKRSQSDKIGRLKYNQQLLKQALAEIEEVKLMLRTIFAGLKESFNFDRPIIERVACQDEVDLASSCQDHDVFIHIIHY